MERIKTSNIRKPRSIRRKLLFAFVPLMLLLLIGELTLRALDYRTPTADPYASFVLHKPLFVVDSDQQTLRTNRDRIGFFHDQSFTINKPAGTVRFFCIGGSTTYGSELANPLNDSYPSQLAARMQQQWPDQQVEAINCGGIAYASYRLVGVVEECLQYSPDFIVIMSGHNEFLEPRHYADIINQTSGPFWYRFRLVHLLMDVIARRESREQKGRWESQEKSTTVLNPDLIEEQYIVRSDSEIQHTLDHYEANLSRMLRACEAANVPVILCTTTSNLRDWPPFVTEPGENANLVQLEQQLGEVSALLTDEKYSEALAICQSVVVTWPKAAMFHFLAGKCYDGLQQTAEARESYILARDTDGFPHRATSAFNSTVRSLAMTSGVSLFDAENALMDASADRIPGAQLFVDNCHPNAKGHQILVDGLSRCIAEHGLLKRSPGADARSLNPTTSKAQSEDRP